MDDQSYLCELLLALKETMVCEKPHMMRVLISAQWLAGMQALKRID